MKLAAIIVETRTGQKYKDVIQQHMKHLKGWDLCVCTLEDNFSYYTDCYQYAVPEIKGDADYNRLLTDPNFWKHFIWYDKVLIFQHDSGILKDNINDFLEYDYVGSPWAFQPSGGNGGLSLRDPKVMMDICTLLPYSPSYGNEDIYFCNYMNEHKFGRLAPREVCKKFAMEVELEFDTFGYHAIDRYHDEKTVKKIKKQEQL